MYPLWGHYTLEDMETNGFPVRKLETSEFPTLLHEIPDLPKALYLRGALMPKTHRVLAVVGSREHSVYGRQAVETLIQGLRGYPISIVSGLAIGIDAIAHRAALDAQLHTVAVPGSGIEDAALYPRSNVRLAREILNAGGALLGELDPYAPAARWTFPARNRIMAGMSHATLIVEAGAKSGTLITARLAMEYNRDVLTIPGSIFSRTSFGPHTLMRDGATPITTSDDIVEALGLRIHTEEIIPTFSGTPKEMLLLTHLGEPIAKDLLIERCGMGAREALMTLTLLELRGVIREDDGIITRLMTPQ